MTCLLRATYIAKNLLSNNFLILRNKCSQLNVTSNILFWIYIPLYEIIMDVVLAKLLHRFSENFLIISTDFQIHSCTQPIYFDYRQIDISKIISYLKKLNILNLISKTREHFSFHKVKHI